MNTINIEDVRDFCLSMKGVTEELPFNDETLIFKVVGKIFILIPLEKTPLQISLKCEPEKALNLREKYQEITPAKHMNKKHWNSVVTSPRISGNQLKNWITHSYSEVVKGLTIKQQQQLSNMT